MAKLNVVRGYLRKPVIFIIVALSAVLVFINSLMTLYSSSPPSSVAAKSVQTVNVNAVVHSLSATFVRIEAPDPVIPGSAASLVLSVEADDLTDFIDAYKRGFFPEVWTIINFNARS